MSNFAGSYTSPYTSPTFVYDISYSQTGRASGSATYSVTVIARMTSSSSSFGYAIDGQVVIGNATKTIRLKNNETWSGTAGHSFTFTLTPTGVSDSGGTINARFYGTRPGAEGNSGKIDTGGDETVTLSVWNTKPSLGGTVTTNPSGIIGENVSSILVSWPSATDTQGGTIYYEVLRELNQSGSWATLSTTTTSTSYSDTIGAGNQGQIIRYAVRARDSSGLVSDPYIYSSYITKNRFTTATLSSSDTILYGDTSIGFSKSGASNTSGSNTFSDSLTSSQITVHNPGSTPTSVAIKTSATGTDTYVLLSDIKNLFRSSGFKGTLNFTLATTNAYGTTGTSTKGISVNLTTAPSAFASAVTTANTYTIGGNSFYIPDKKAILISWGACTDLVDGGTITYDIQVSYDSGATYSTIKTGNTTTSYTTTLPQVTSAKYCKFNIIAKTSYGTSRSLALVNTITLHYYNPPTIVFNDTVRTQTEATVSGTINYNTSILPTYIVVSTVSPSTYYTTSGGLVKPIAATTYTALSRGFTATFDIGDTVSCSFNITAQDSGGIAVGTAATTLSKTIPVYTPMLALRSTGVGINAIPSGTNNKLVVGGNTKINGALSNNLDGTHSLYENVKSYSYGAGSITGIMKITFPVGWTSTMYSIEIDGYDYSADGSWKLIAGGYSYLSTPAWTNNSAQIVGEAPFAKVRFAYDGSKVCLLLGTTTTVWSYPKIVVSKVIAGHTNHTGLEIGWSISCINTETGLANIFTITDASSINNTGTISSNGGRLVLRDNSLEEWATNGNNAVSVNYYGYGGGTTQFRDFNIYNGKGGLVAQFIGSTGIFSAAGSVSIGGNLNGYRIGGASANWWGSVPLVATNGVTDIGKYIDFHDTDAGTTDYDARITSASGKLTASGGWGNVGKVPAFTWSGTIAYQGSVTITMNLAYEPIYSAYGTTGNVNLNFGSTTGTSVVVTNWIASGGNSWTGDIYFW